jgi:hypothetical protein
MSISKDASTYGQNNVTDGLPAHSKPCDAEDGREISGVKTFSAVPNPQRACE